jgi:hypothetical protein
MLPAGCLLQGTVQIYLAASKELTKKKRQNYEKRF